MADLLKDKVAVITGAGRGIGRGVAKLMAEEGAKVVVADLGVNVDGSGQDDSPAAQVVREIQDTGGTAVACYENVALMEGGERIVQSAIDNFGKLDIVVTPAGILRDRMVFNMTEQEWDDVIAVHMKGTFTVVKHASILFRQQRSGRIVTFSSTSGLIGNSGQANYGAAKDGIAGFTRVVARDLGRYGVTANAISPAADTRMTGTVSEESRAIRAQRGIAGAGVRSEMRRDPEDIAPFVTWLASDEAGHVNGHVFHVAGGMVGLMNEPEPVKTIHKEGRWDVEEIIRLFPQTLGVELINPAPAQPPPQPSA
jgi:NAD(P)-dependent dehydrogenase (short-subunit alcohol dehydrogenase family)